MLLKQYISIIVCYMLSIDLRHHSRCLYSNIIPLKLTIKNPLNFDSKINKYTLLLFIYVPMKT